MDDWEEFFENFKHSMVLFVDDDKESLVEIELLYKVFKDRLIHELKEMMAEEE